MKIDIDKKKIRTVSLGLATILTAVGLLKLYKDQMIVAIVLLYLGMTSLILAFFFQSLMKPVYIVFMKVAHILGWINTRILLGIIYYIIITPIGVIMKVFGKDLLDKRIKPDKGSYWVKREKIEFDKSRYEKQF